MSDSDDSPLKIVNYPWSDSADEDPIAVDGTGIVGPMFDDTDSSDDDPSPQETPPAISNPASNEESCHAESQSSIQADHEPPTTSNQIGPDSSSTEHSVGSESAQETSTLPPPSKRTRMGRKYALNKDELPPMMENFLKCVKLFFTKPLNLERLNPAISNSTWDKAYERICCKYIYCLYIMSYDCYRAAQESNYLEYLYLL